MHPAYKSDKELCKWLRDNSSGNYRLAAFAAERIETLTIHLQNTNTECDRLENELEQIRINGDALIDEAILAIKNCELVEPNVKRIRLYEAIGALVELKAT